MDLNLITVIGCIVINGTGQHELKDCEIQTLEQINVKGQQDIMEMIIRDLVHSDREAYSLTTQKEKGDSIVYYPTLAYSHFGVADK